MFFASDNTGPVHAQVMDALIDANSGYAMPYGNDALTAKASAQIRETFEAPEAAVYLVATGTAANSLILATLTQPWETVFCAPSAHIHEDECNAPEFFSGGAKLTLVGGENAKISPAALRTAIETEENRGVHGPQRGPISLTQVTERGTVYSLDEIRALTAIARQFNLVTHMDGARFANALVSLGCTAAEMTWKAGIDAVSFGGTKNGLMGVEAMIFFDPRHAWEFELRRKRAAHLFSKHRFLSAQMSAYLENDLWLDSARAANAATARLARGLKQIEDVSLMYEPQANIIFAQWPRATHKRLHEAGAKYEIVSGNLAGGDNTEMLSARLVCDWSTTEANVDQFIGLVKDSATRSPALQRQ